MEKTSIDLSKINTETKLSNIEISGSNKTESDTSVKELLQRQVCHEFDNERLYLAMALWCDHHGYVETAKFYKKHTKEERRHGMDFINHMLMRHYKVKPPCEKEQPEDFDGLEDVLKKSIAREKETTRMIREIHAEALKTHDPALTIADKYLVEQLEEEQLFMSLYNLFKLTGGNKIDFEMEVLRLKDKHPKYKIGNL